MWTLLKGRHEENVGTIISWPKDLSRPCPFGIFNWTVIGTRFHMEQISVVASYRDHSSKVNGQIRLLRVLRYSSISSVWHSSRFTLSFKTSIDSRFTYYFVPFLDARRHGSRLARKDSAWGRWELNWHELDLFVVRSEHIPCWDAFMLKCLRDLATGFPRNPQRRSQRETRGGAIHWRATSLQAPRWKFGFQGSEEIGGFLMCRQTNYTIYRYQISRIYRIDMNRST